MKYIALLSIGMLSLSACKKDYACNCVTTTAGISTSAKRTINGTKADAKTECAKGNSSATVLGVTVSVSCSII